MATERLAYHNTPVTAIYELRHHLEAAWTTVSLHTIQSLNDAMPWHITAVIVAGGGCFIYRLLMINYLKFF